MFKIGFSRTHVLMLLVLITGLSLALNLHSLADIWHALDEAEAEPEEIQVFVERVKIPADEAEAEGKHGNGADRSGRARSGRDLRARDPR